MHFARLPFPFFKYISLPKRVIECIPKTYLSNMQTKYTYKQIWLIAYPILISLLMEQMIGMTDTAFLGRVGEIELGASAIAGIFYIVMFMVAFGFSIGAQILIARRNGEQQYKEIGNLFYQGVYFQLGMAAVMFALCYSFAPVILKRLVSSHHIYDAAMSYLNWRVFGFFFSFTAVMFRAFFLGTTQTKTLTLNSIVMVLSNVVFNYILIFGKFGVPQLGIAGAAIGSSLAELVSLIFFILYTRHRIDIRKYGLDKIPGIRWSILKRMLNVSFWTMVQNFLSLSTWFLLFLYVEHLGERSLAVTNIIRNVSGIMFMVMMAFASTCGSLVSNLIGAGHTDCLPGTIRQHIRIAYAFVLPLAVFFALGWDDLREVALQSIYINCVLFVINMIPIPPLDGSRFLKYAVDMSEQTYAAISRYGILILLLIVNIPFTASIFMFITRTIAAVFIYIAAAISKIIT